jgi:hypothetical protein
LARRSLGGRPACCLRLTLRCTTARGASSTGWCFRRRWRGCASRSPRRLQRQSSAHAYARQCKNKDLEADAFEIRKRAERRLGEMMAEEPKAQGTRGAGRPKKGGSRKNPPKNETTLAAQGIDKNLADRGAAKGRQMGRRRARQGRWPRQKTLEESFPQGFGNWAAPPRRDDGGRAEGQRRR